MTMDFLLGSDPELMLTDEDGNLKSAIGIIDGTKEAPLPLNEGAAQYDNVNAEFNITPASSEDEWVERHRNVMSQLNSIVGNLRLLVRASADFPRSELEHPFAKRFACDPDFNPYTMSVNIMTADASEGTLRSCGGHIHIGNNIIADDFDIQVDTVKVMDIFLGIPSLLLDKDPTSQRRRILYGKAGAHRPKPYGIEYRALGNFWLSHPVLTRLMYRLVRDGLDAYMAGHTSSINENAVRKTIDNGRIDRAEKAVKGLIVPLMREDTRELFISALELPHSDIYTTWEL